MEIKADTLLQKAKKELKELSPQPYQEALWILSNLLNKKNSQSMDRVLDTQNKLQSACQKTYQTQDLYLDQTLISTQQEQEFWKYIQKRKKHYPLDYILEESYFLGHKFFVQEGVFIPRPDTETLVKQIFNQYSKDKSFQMMDWGAGPGTICLSLLSYFSKATCLAVDIHSKSLSCLKKNRDRFGLKDRVFLLQGDVCNIDFKKERFFSESISLQLQSTHFDKKKEENNFHLIIANPPYIDPQDSQIDKSVYLFEPPVALFSKQKGMGHIYSWFYKAMDCLNSGACYTFEFGWNQSKLVKDFLSSNQSTASYEILKDSMGYDRVAWLIKK